jgi:hypothetical protein
MQARSTINSNLGSTSAQSSTNKKDIKESVDSVNNVTIEDDESKIEKIGKFFFISQYIQIYV